LVRKVLQKTLTYLTIVSAILLPAVGALWLRSYSINDRITRVDNGSVWIASTMNGQAVIWHGSTYADITLRDHRKREVTEGMRPGYYFRDAGAIRFNVLGLIYGQVDQLPSRMLDSTGPAKGVIIPLWMAAVVFSILPGVLLVRNTQSSEEWRREHESTTPAEPEAPDAAPAPAPDDLVLPDAPFRSTLPHRPIRPVPSMRRWR
jgi:hypothetical protein